ncbi:MAG TPA: exopolysaccharide biosynthesis protein [Variovorax sp.]|nr:exopolysaccharide biosynthesis protein [Variovorax sp.]
MEHGEVHSVSDILDTLERSATRSSEVSGGEIVQAFGGRSYGPFLILPALLELSPLGGLPGVASAMALLVVLVATQLLRGKRCCWLPEFMAKRSIHSDKLTKAIAKMRPLGRWLDKWFHGRLRSLTRRPFVRTGAIACILLAMAVPLFELVPFASTAPMAAIALFGLALLVHDGALMIAASVASFATVVLVFVLLPRFLSGAL